MPLIFAGPGIKHGIVRRQVGPEETASAISAYLGVAAPSGSASTSLVEILGE